MLSERRQRVLSALIEEYIAHALPVGSRTLTQRYALGVSSATIRNELSKLESDGYIIQPHTSAGRIPTDVGYRAFVDDLLENELSGDASLDQALIEDLREQATELDDLMNRTSYALTRLTDCLSIVLPPSVLSLHIKQISFVQLAPYRVLIIVVTEVGQVLNRTVDFNQEIDAGYLAVKQELFNRVFAGKSFVQIRDTMDIDTAVAFSDELSQLLLSEMFACLKDHEGIHCRSLGLSALISKPEFSNLETVLPVVRMVEDDTVLLHIIDDTEYNGDTIVRIGHENRNEGLRGVSVVACHYGRGDAEGIVAVVGPTRMDYSQVIKAVRTARNVLQGSA